MEQQVGVLHLDDLLAGHLLEVHAVPHLTVDLVLNLGENVLHVHDGAVKGEALP